MLWNQWKGSNLSATIPNGCMMSYYVCMQVIFIGKDKIKALKTPWNQSVHDIQDTFYRYWTSQTVLNMETLVNKCEISHYSVFHIYRQSYNKNMEIIGLQYPGTYQTREQMIEVKPSWLVNHLFQKNVRKFFQVVFR